MPKLKVELPILIHLIINLISIKNCVSQDAGGIVEGCTEYDLAFGCKDDETAVVIREAWLHDELYREPKYKCQIPEYYVQFKKASILQHINKKCSMQRSCRFRALEDIPGAKQDEDKWRGGVIRVNYECVKVVAFERSCGETLEGQEGWVQNIGYPKYYLGPGACTFTLVVDPGQRVVLKITDLSLREISRPTESECVDYLSVTEGGRGLYSLCGDLNRPVVIESQGNSVNVTLHSSVEVFPKRGFIAHFQAAGCQTPPIPADGYLSHRDETHAEFWCCVRHVFPDMKRIRRLTCQYEMKWDNDVPDCIDLDDLLASGNITEDEYLRYNGTMAASMFTLRQAVVYDIIVPGLIMGFLIIGNIGVLFMIILCRRRVRQDPENLEELESIKANAEPTDVREPNPCEV